MRDWFQTQLAAGFPAFAGSSVSGTLAVKQEMLNELLAAWLAESALHADGTKGPLDLGRSVTVIKSATVRAEPGTVLVDFKIVV
jgi:hypothetical protein